MYVIAQVVDGSGMPFSRCDELSPHVDHVCAPAARKQGIVVYIFFLFTSLPSFVVDVYDFVVRLEQEQPYRRRFRTSSVMCRLQLSFVLWASWQTGIFSR